MKGLFRYILIVFGLLFVAVEVNAQIDRERGITTEVVIYKGDTIPVMNLETVEVYAPLVFNTRREQREYDRLHKYVVKVYPYAEVAGEMLKYFDDTLQTFKTDGAKKKYLKNVEEQLKAEFGSELKNLTIKQGIILIKLIDRETGTTSYDIIKQFRGSFSAFFWQSLARLFGSNLKLEYEPDGEDYMIEDIVLRIESGQIPYEKRERKL